MRLICNSRVAGAPCAPTFRRRMALPAALFAFVFGITSGRIVAQTQRPKSAEELKGQFRQAVQLQRQKDYVQSSKLLKEYLADAPSDQLARCLLLNIEVRTHEKSAAIEELAILKRSPIPPNLSNVVSKLEVAVGNFELERSLNKALVALKPGEATDIVDRMAIGAQQKELLKYYVDLRQGNLASALFRAMTLDHLTVSDSSAAAPTFREKVSEDTDLFTKIQQRVDWYRYSALTNGSCTSDWIRQEIPKQHYEIQQEYMKIVANSEKEFPLSSWVLDHAFFATLISDRPYEDLEAFGDTILDAKGILRIPFYSRDALFNLVIDTRTHHIRTEPDPHVRLNESGSDKMQIMMPFDLPFDQVVSIDQKTSTELANGSLSSSSYALRLEPAGLAPRYAFMDAIQCLDGEAKQKSVTQKLGRYVAHVIGNSKTRVHLVDPEKKTIDWMRATSNTIAIGTIAGAQMANVGNNGAATTQAAAVSQEAMKVVAQNKADAAAEKRIVLAQNEERKVWHEDLAHVIFSAIDAESAETLVKDENKLLALADEAVTN
jgi:hypothetical protein